jgi:twitching motility protein PilJ
MAVPAIKPNLSGGLGKLVDKLGPRLSIWMDKLGSRDPETMPILRDIPGEQRTPVIMLALLISLVLAVVFFVAYALVAGRQTNQVEEATHLQMLSQRIAKSAQQAALGNKTAFAQLKQGRDDFDQALNYLTGGGVDSGATPNTRAGDLAELHRVWQSSRKGLDTLLNQEVTLVDIGQAINQINVRNTELLDLTEQLGALLPAGSGRLAAYTNQQALWTQRMAKNANALIAGDVINPETAFQLGKDTKTYREILNGMLEGSAELGLAPVSDPQAKEKLLELRETFTTYEGQINTLLKNMAQLVEAKRASRAIFEDSEKLLNAADRLTERFEGTWSWLLLFLAIVFSLLTIGSLVLLVLGNAAESRKRAEEAARVNQRNQDAILRLLNEMGDLAEGNLAVRATVTEDITGAIADSVNFAIEELRSLVDNINRAAVRVTRSTEEAKELTARMQDTTQRQSREIAETTTAINHMSDTIIQVSGNAAESAEVAKLSLTSAQRGGDSVRDAIAGMNSIRDQIQETSKRIKRLGESSQEIGEIVDLISDITEQTNVLALNAAIQAAAAGEAGRGFTVVAEEVQRLAERSAQATRRIGAIVKTIQSDTQDAVHAMELSTQGVVAGTSLSDTAGKALQDIQSVSEKLAGLIENISNATRGQADTASQVAENMRRILDETRQASESANASAESIGQLVELSDELKLSVAGFKV